MMWIPITKRQINNSTVEAQQEALRRKQEAEAQSKTLEEQKQREAAQQAETLKLQQQREKDEQLRAQKKQQEDEKTRHELEAQQRIKEQQVQEKAAKNPGTPQPGIQARPSQATPQPKQPESQKQQQPQQQRQQQQQSKQEPPQSNSGSQNDGMVELGTDQMKLQQNPQGSVATTSVPAEESSSSSTTGSPKDNSKTTSSSLKNNISNGNSNAQEEPKNNESPKGNNDVKADTDVSSSDRSSRRLTSDAPAKLSSPDIIDKPDGSTTVNSDGNNNANSNNDKKNNGNNNIAGNANSVTPSIPIVPKSPNHSSVKDASNQSYGFIDGQDNNSGISAAGMKTVDTIAIIGSIAGALLLVILFIGVKRKINHNNPKTLNKKVKKSPSSTKKSKKSSKKSNEDADFQMSQMMPNSRKSQNTPFAHKYPIDDYLEDSQLETNISFSTDDRSEWNVMAAAIPIPCYISINQEDSMFSRLDTPNHELQSSIYAESMYHRQSQIKSPAVHDPRRSEAKRTIYSFFEVLRGSKGARHTVASNASTNSEFEGN